MHRGFLACLGIAAAALVSTGCINLSDPLGRERALEITQREYTNLVRWGEIEKASMYVDPALRQDYLGSLEDFEQIRVTDFDIGNIRYEDSGEAEVVVTYRAFARRRAMEVPIREKQRWYRDGVTNSWLVRPDIEGFGELLVR